jgi:hypothetical protein
MNLIAWLKFKFISGSTQTKNGSETIKKLVNSRSSAILRKANGIKDTKINIKAIFSVAYILPLFKLNAPLCAIIKKETKMNTPPTVALLAESA